MYTVAHPFACNGKQSQEDNNISYALKVVMSGNTSLSGQSMWWTFGSLNEFKHSRKSTEFRKFLPLMLISTTNSDGFNSYTFFIHVRVPVCFFLGVILLAKFALC